jgi:hypothetical protein
VRFIFSRQRTWWRWMSSGTFRRVSGRYWQTFQRRLLPPSSQRNIPEANHLWRLEVFVNTILKRIFGPERKNVTGRWRKWFIGVHKSLYWHNIVGVCRLAEYVAQREKRKTHTKFDRKLYGRRPTWETLVLTEDIKETKRECWDWSQMTQDSFPRLFRRWKLTFGFFEGRIFSCSQWL